MPRQGYCLILVNLSVMASLIIITTKYVIYYSRQQMPKPEKLDPSKLLQSTLPTTTRTITEQQAIIYSLGISLSQDPLKESEHKFTSELNGSFTVFPTMAATVPSAQFIPWLMEHEEVPVFHPAMILHGSQRVEMIRGIKVGCCYLSRGRLVDLVDRGKFAEFVFRYESVEESTGRVAFVNIACILVKGLGGFGFKGLKYLPPIPKIPTRKQDYKLTATSYKNQCFIYRLSGDSNPLHIDPKFAAIQKLPQPILHGLATKGIVTRAILEQFTAYDTSQYRMFECRFIGHVFPGESFDISVWKEGRAFVYMVQVSERNSKVLSGSFQLAVGGAL